jgi:hypothetical protein
VLLLSYLRLYSLLNCHPAVILTHAQVVDDSISSIGHLQLQNQRQEPDQFDPIIPETQTQSLFNFYSDANLSSPWPLVQSPLLEASIKQAINSNLSLTQNSGYLASSEDEGFGGSEFDDSPFQQENLGFESLPNAQQFEFSSAGSSDFAPFHESRSQALSITGEFRHLPQSTHPDTIDHSPGSDILGALATTTEDLSDSVAQPPPIAESASNSPSIPAPASMRGVRTARTGTTAPTTQNEDGDAPATRKSLRALRKEADAKRAEIIARTKKPTEQDGTDSKQKTPESETQSSAGAGKPRGRKKKDVKGDQSSLNTDSNTKSNGTSTSSGDIAKSNSTSQHSTLGPKLPSMQFIVPMPLVPQAGDQYRRTVVYNKVLIENFTAKHSPTPEIVKEAGEFVQTMRNICMHLDLANEEESLSDVLPSQQMTWDRSISSKFQLMASLFEQLQDQKLTIVIFASPGKILDMVEKFVRGHDISFSCPERNLHVSSTKETRQLQIALLPSKGYELPASGIPADLIIALDHGMDVHQPEIRTMRLHGSRLAPIIFLTVLNSIDHVDKVMASTWKGASRIQTEVACIAKLRMEAGKLNNNFQAIADVGELIAEFVINSGTEDDWPVVPIGPLADNESWDLAMGHTILRNQENEPARKRSRDSSVDGDIRNTKKARMSAAPTEIEDAASGYTELSDSRISESEMNQQLCEQSTKFNKIQEDLKAQLAELKTTMKRKDAHVRDLERDFDKQMNRFEGQNRELESLRRELEEANEKIANIRELKMRRDETIITLKEENRALKDQLQEASKALENSSIPEVSELARIRREKEEAETAMDRAVKNAESAQKLTGYLQDQYRAASDRAIEVVEQNEILEAKVKDLERKASGEAVRLQQASTDTKQQMAMTEVSRLRVELKNVKTVLAKKEEELKTKRGGIGTRAGSVPRSPRVGPASRAASPIPDRRIETLRNNTLYVYLMFTMFTGSRHTTM